MTQLSFSIRTSASCKTVHLVGSWDGYAGQLPMSRASGAKKDAWSGTFRFNASVIRDGERYWYYYVIDGYHVSHDPACDATTEPKTGRRLNVLITKNGLPVKCASAAKSTASKAPPKAPASSRGHARHLSVEVPRGRPLSPSRIMAPRPVKPAAVASPRAASSVSEAQISEHGSTTVAHLAAQLDRTRIGESAETVDWDQWGSDYGSSAYERSSSSCSGSDSSDVESLDDSGPVSPTASWTSSAPSFTSASSCSSNASSPDSLRLHFVDVRGPAGACGGLPAKPVGRAPVAALAARRGAPVHVAADQDSEFDFESGSE